MKRVKLIKRGETRTLIDLSMIQGCGTRLRRRFMRPTFTPTLVIEGRSISRARVQLVIRKTNNEERERISSRYAGSPQSPYSGMNVDDTQSNA